MCMLLCVTKLEHLLNRLLQWSQWQGFTPACPFVCGHVRRLANRLNDLTQWLSYIHICVLLCFWPQLLQGNRVNYDFNANTDVTIASLGL